MYLHLRYGEPAPHEVVVWELVERTGWTLEYIESLPVGRLHEWLQINDAKARNAASRKGGR